MIFANSSDKKFTFSTYTNAASQAQQVQAQMQANYRQLQQQQQQQQYYSGKMGSSPSLSKGQMYSQTWSQSQPLAPALNSSSSSVYPRMGLRSLPSPNSLGQQHSQRLLAPRQGILSSPTAWEVAPDDGMSRDPGKMSSTLFSEVAPGIGFGKQRDWSGSSQPVRLSW